MKIIQYTEVLPPGTVVKIINGGQGCNYANGRHGVVVQTPRNKPENYGGVVYEDAKCIVYCDGEYSGLGINAELELLN